MDLFRQSTSPDRQVRARALGLFRAFFFSGVIVHYFPAFFAFDENFGRDAFRIGQYNATLHDLAARLPLTLVMPLVALTMLACLGGALGLCTRLCAAVSLVGLYFFASMNALSVGTLALETIWILLPVLIFVTTDQALSLRSLLDRKKTDGDSPPAGHDGRSLPAASGPTADQVGALLLSGLVLVSLFFAGVEKLTAGWPLQGGFHQLADYPAGFVVRGWLVELGLLRWPGVAVVANWATVLLELTLPLAIAWRRTRLWATVVYQAFFLSIIVAFEVPFLFWFAYAPAPLLLLSAREVRRAVRLFSLQQPTFDKALFGEK